MRKEVIIIIWPSREHFTRINCYFRKLLSIGFEKLDGGVIFVGVS
jgi:hypothetical protein